MSHTLLASWMSFTAKQFWYEWPALRIEPDTNGMAVLKSFYLKQLRKEQE